MKRWLPALLLLPSPACFYSFDNPVELEDAGSIAGRVVFTQNTSGLSAAGGQVGLLWTDLAITVQDDGRFLFLGLPDGVYTLKYELDPGDGGLPLIAFLSGITLPEEQGNIPDAINLGTIELEPAARVTGHVTGLDGGPAVVGAFSGGGDGGEIYESFTVMTDDGGNFTLDLPHGSHDIWASTAAMSGSMPVTVPSGQVTDLGDLPLSPPTLGAARSGRGPRADPSDGDLNGELEGDLVLGLPGFGIGASPGAVEDAGLVQDNVEIDPPPPPQDPFALAEQVPGKGAHMDQPLPPGQLYPTIYCGLKGSQRPGPATLNDIGLNGIPTFVGHPTILGQITWLPVSTFAANNQPPPVDYLDAGGTTGGATGTGGTSTGGSATGGTSSGGATSTGGYPFQGWGSLGQAAVADAGTDYSDPFIPIPSAQGPMLFYTNNEMLYLVSTDDGGLVQVATLDNGGNNLQLLAATTDELGVPSALIDMYEPANGENLLSVAQYGESGRWIMNFCQSPSYTNFGRALLLPAPPGSGEDGGPSLYVVFLDDSSELTVAPSYPNGQGCLPTTVNSPDSGDAGIGSWLDLAGTGCILDGHPGACLAMSDYQGSVVALGIDLFSPANSVEDPLIIFSFPRGILTALGLSAVVTGPPGSELLTTTWYDGEIDPVYGQLVAQRVPVNDLTIANPGGLPQPLYIDAGYDPDSGAPLYDFENTLALSSGDVPFVLAQGRASIVGNFAPPLRNFTFDLLLGNPFPDLPSSSGTASAASGYVDANGNPVVGLAGDQGSLLDAQIWTYYP